MSGLLFRDDVWMEYLQASGDEGVPASPEDFERYLAEGYVEVENPENEDEPFYVERSI